MKKRNEPNNQARRPSSDFPSMSYSGGKQESAQDFALHLAAMFRAELGEEDEQLDPVLNWDLPVFEADYQNAESNAGNDDELFRAVADFLDGEVGEAPGARDEAFEAPQRTSRADREAQRRAEREAQRQADREARRQAEQEARRQAEQEAQRRAEREAQRRAEQEARRQAEQEAQRQADREARRQAEQEAQRQAEQEAQRRAEREAQRRAEWEAKRRAEREAKRQTQRAGQSAEKRALPTEETAPQERMVFFEPKQKKNTFFDSLSDPESAENPARGELPAEPVREPHRTDRAAAEQSARRDRRQESSRREQRQEASRRDREQKPSGRADRRGARRAEKEDRNDRFATRTRQGREETRRTGAAERTVSEREPTRAVLRGFSAVPFEPPREDPSLDELFGPLGLKTAPPDPNDSPALRGRTTRSFEEAAGDEATGVEATGNRQQATGDEGTDPSTPLRSAQDDTLETLPVGAVIDRPLEATGNRQQATGVEARDSSVGAVIDRPLEATGNGQQARGDEGTDPSAPLRSAQDDTLETLPVGAAIGRPLEATGNRQQATGDEGTDPSTPLRSAQDDTLETLPVGAVIDRPPEAEAFDDDTRRDGTLPSAPPEAEAFDEDTLRRDGTLPSAPPQAEAPDERPTDDGATDTGLPVFAEPTMPSEEEISTEDAILEVLRLLGDIPPAEETPAASAEEVSAASAEETPSAPAEPEAPESARKADPAPVRPRREKKRGWLRSLFGGTAADEAAPVGAAIGRPPEATGNGQQATGNEETPELSGSGAHRAPREAIGDEGTDPSTPLRSAQDDTLETLPAGAAIDRPPEATGNGQQAIGDEGTDPSTPLRSAQDDTLETLPAGAAIGRPPEAETFDEDTLRRDGTLPSAPPEAEASDDDTARRDGTLPSAPPQAETPDEAAPAGTAVDLQPEAEAFDEATGNGQQATEVEATGNGQQATGDEGTDSPVEAVIDRPPETEISEALPEPAPVPERSGAETAAWDPDEPWSDDQLLAAVDELLERPFFAGTVDFAGAASSESESTDEPTGESILPEDGEPAPEDTALQGAEGVPFSRREYDALTVSELFDFFGLQRDPEPAAAEADGLRAPEAPDPEAPTGTGPAFAPDFVLRQEEIGEASAERIEAPAAFAEPFETVEIPAAGEVPASDHAPELWDPLSLFSAPVDDGPPPLTPLTRDNTGSLPSLEELFGPVKEPEPKAPRPAERPARPRKKRSWLQNLLGTPPTRRERPSLQGLEEATGNRQQATGDEGTDSPVGAVIDRPPEATGNGQQATGDEGTDPSAPLRSAQDDALETLPVGAVIDRPIEAETFDEATGNGQQATGDEGTDPSASLRSAQDDTLETLPVGAVIDRPPEAEAFDEDTLRRDGTLPSAPPQAETPDEAASVETAIDRPPEAEAFDDDTRRDGTLPSAPPEAELLEEAPTDSPADDWDPLALFGGQAEDAELPTWEEYLRSRRAPAPAEQTPEPPAPTEPGSDAVEPAGVNSFEPAELPVSDADGEPAEDRTPETGTEPAAEPRVGHEPAPVWTDFPFPDRDPTLEEMFGAPASEPETVPMDLTVTPEDAAALRQRPENEALTLADFLAAAVPAEDSAGQEPPAERPRGTGPEQTLTFGPAEPETISTARENPAGLVLTWMEEAAEEALPAQEPSAQELPAPAPAQNQTAESAASKAFSRGEKRRGEAGKEGRKGNRQQTAGEKGGQAAFAPKEAILDTRWPEPPFGENAAVPSADVRRPAAPAAAEKQPRRREWREEEVLPPEEKSILHPEEAYRVYARPLDAIGSRLILTGLFTILSLFFTLYLARNWTFLPEIFSGGITVYILLALLGFMVITNRKLYFTEWRDETGLRPALLLALATVFTALDCISAAKTLRPPFTVVVGALLMIELWGRYDRGLGMLATLKVLRAEQLPAGVSEVQDITKGSRGLVRTEPDVDRFMEKLETRDLTDRLLRIYTPAAAIICLVLTLLITLGLKRDPCWTGALVFLGSVPVTGLLAYSRLFCLLARRLTDAQAALCGYHGAEVFGGEHSILIGDDDIFPAGSLTLNGFKVYNGNPDRMIAYAAAACRSSGSALDPIFEDLLVTHNGRHYSVDNFRFYDSGGIGASIQQDVVLMGSLDFMRRMGVHMDRGARVKQAVYMSLNGELAAVFAVRYNPPENLRRGLAAIAGNRHFKGILVTRTFLGTPGFLKAKFGIPTGAFSYPSTKERIRLSEAEMKRSGAQGAILARDSFSGFAQAAAGGRLLRSATLGAAILTVLGGLTGLILMGVLAALGAIETATALNVLLYVAAWLVPTLLLTAWIRHF